MAKCNLSDDFENTVNKIEAHLSILVEETQCATIIMKAISAKLDGLANRGESIRLESVMTVEPDYLSKLTKIYQSGALDTVEFQRLVNEFLDDGDSAKTESQEEPEEEQLVSESNDVVTPGSILGDMINLRFRMRKVKPNDRSDIDRHFAITITDMEKLIAYFSMFAFPE
jgi:hypothetical protein